MDMLGDMLLQGCPLLSSDKQEHLYISQYSHSSEACWVVVVINEMTL